MIITSQTKNTLGCASGSWRIWALSDGYVDLPANLLKEPDGRVHALPRTLDRAGAMLRLSVNCFVAEGPEGPAILIDCGAGGSWDPTMGHLEEALAEAGIDPASIASVAMTHGHGDHINGLLTPDGRELFPGLVTVVMAAEAMTSFLAESRLRRYEHRMKPARSGEPVAAGVMAQAMPGHAPGHMAYRLSTGEDDILFCGDMIHVHAAQFARPELTWTYDLNQTVARATRLELMREAAEKRTWLAGAHVDFPGIGRIVAEGQGYAFKPVS